MPAHNMNLNAKPAEIKISYRNKVKASDRPKINSSLCAYELLYESWDHDAMELNEHFKVLYLDHRNSCIGIVPLAVGGISACMVDLRLAFAGALKARATAMILAHNHPSGNKKFSEQDKRLTEKFAEAGKVLDIKVFDHLVLTAEGYSSLADEGLMP